ncbi:hypothetical protein ACRW58_24305, partial [Escherichia coli]
KQKKLIMLPSEIMIWQPEFTDKILSRKPGAVHNFIDCLMIVGVKMLEQHLFSVQWIRRQAIQESLALRSLLMK